MCIIFTRCDKSDIIFSGFILFARVIDAIVRTESNLFHTDLGVKGCWFLPRTGGPGEQETPDRVVRSTGILHGKT